jgi:hypothetical protein
MGSLPILLLSAMAVVQAPTNAPTPPAPMDSPAAPAPVPWSEIAKHPSRYVGRDVRVRVQMSARVASWNPYITRFGTSQFSAFDAWSDEQLPWLKSDFDAPAVRVFARRGGACEWALEKLKTYDRFELLVSVREIFLERPWAEIVEVLPLSERLTEGTVIHAGRACGLMHAGTWTLAENEIAQALNGALPPAARGALLRLREECRRASPPVPTKPKAAVPAVAGRTAEPVKKPPRP